MNKLFTIILKYFYDIKTFFLKLMDETNNNDGKPPDNMYPLW